MEPVLSTDCNMREATYTLGKKNIVFVQIDAKMELLHRSANCTVRLYVCDHATWHSSLLLELRFSFVSLAQVLQFIDALA